MVTDALMAPILGILEWVVGLIPEYSPDFGGVSAVVVWIARLDMLIPIAGPLSVMLGVLSAVVVFVLGRLALTAWNVVWP